MAILSSPQLWGHYFASSKIEKVSESHEAFKESKNQVEGKINKLHTVKGSQSVDQLHRRLGQIMWDRCGMSRNKEGLESALQEIPKLKEEFWNDVRIPGQVNELNPELEKAMRVADFMELGELMCRDALTREESCGGHFREEFQTEDNEALRNDESFCHVQAWEDNENGAPTKHTEELKFENVKLTQRSYK